jgi:hypothetical protein
MIFTTNLFVYQQDEQIKRQRIGTPETTGDHHN